MKVAVYLTSEGKTRELKYDINDRILNLAPDRELFLVTSFRRIFNHVLRVVVSKHWTCTITRNDE